MTQELIELADAYAEARHASGAPAYNEKSATARQALLDAIEAQTALYENSTASHEDTVRRAMKAEAQVEAQWLEIERLGRQILSDTDAFLKVREERDTLQARLEQPTEPAPKRPINCGTGHCSCIECVVEPAPPVCKCSMRTKLVGDGCDVCNPELAAEMREPAPSTSMEDALVRTTQLNEMSLATIQTLREVSDEYNAWIRFHASGGDYDDFLKQYGAFQ